jgi:hypothetical protein
MTTLVVAGAQAAGQALVKTASAAALSYANSAISQIFDNRVFEGPRLSSFQLMTSRDGSPMARSYGRVRLAGQVIWASRLKEIVTEEKQGKGGPTARNYSYTISFALGICEGEIQSIDRIWVNGQVLRTSGVTYRIYNGSETQNPDPVLSAIDGDVPAFRGTAYIVFEDFPLDDYGARLPQFNVEVTRVPPRAGSAARLENLVSGVHLLPSSGEFAYAADIIEDVSAPGAARPVNMNNLSGQSDILQALDQLETSLPNCRNVSLVISWFGDDLRAGECTIRPGVETLTRAIDGEDWQVAGISREDAYVVSVDNEERPRYGGTPSDASIVQAIRELKSRGYRVTIYPFILMDIPPDNTRPDPYGGAAQAPLPWRGRITVHPAAGQAQSADQTPRAAEQVEQFYEGEQGLKRFILHYADLAAESGGVDRFVISSELIGLTTARSSRDNYPFVEKLKSLARDVKSKLPLAELSYAADWSEYFGHHPQDGSGDLTFHLDPLWADSNIDAVGIDAYFPLSDWREGFHADAQIAGQIYDLEYLSQNLQSGEGFEFYYASQSDRQAQIRTPITDHAYNKPWVYRYKDLLNWWINPHINRRNGKEVQASAWKPRSKPFWLTEIGCPAIDKGANQPNVFYDPKSSESKIPYFSSGARDDLIQRRYIEAFLSFYGQPSNNPNSPEYGGPMVDMSAAHVWCWDARPYPDFPAREDVWSDGGNWQLGHWLTGRTGLVLVADVVQDLVQRSGVASVDVSQISGVLEGFVIDRPMSTRAALAPLALTYGFDMAERAEGLAFAAQSPEAPLNLSWQDIAALPHDAAPVTRIKDDPEGRLRDVRLHYIDGGQDHQTASVFAREQRAETQNILDVELPLVLDSGFARAAAARLLHISAALDQRAEFLLSPMRLDVEVGDHVSLPGQSGVWQITRLDAPGSAGGAMRVIAKASSNNDGAAEFQPPVARAAPTVVPAIAWASKPELIVLDLPDYTGESRKGIMVGGQVTPFNRLQISAGETPIELGQPALVGVLEKPLGLGPVGRMDYGGVLEFKMTNADLGSVDMERFLSGANLFAVQALRQAGARVSAGQGWEILQARTIELIAPDQYRARGLLRGRFGSDADMSALTTGARIVCLNQGLGDLATPRGRGESLTVQARVAGRVSEPYELSYEARHLRPLSPVHGRAEIKDGELKLNWIRRTRQGGESWSGLDVPLGEDIALFRVEALKEGVVIETREAERPEAILYRLDAERIRISQGSTVYGFGPPLIIELPPAS